MEKTAKLARIGTILMAILLAAPFAAVVQAKHHPSKKSVPALVSTDWLAQNLNNPKLVILDVRAPDAYLAGHIPGAVNSPAFGNWFIMTETLWLELPPPEALFATMEAAGISRTSSVVIVSGAESPYALADATRVPIALLYAGFKNFGILNGGNDKWVREGRPVSSEAFVPTPTLYSATLNEDIVVSKDYVQDKIGESIILDARDANVYFGVATEPWAERPGHIPTARNLPMPWLWEAEGTYKDPAVLLEMAVGVTRRLPWMHQEQIVYCGVGGYGAALHFVLQEVLGYRNVKFYDGSAQEWSADPDAPLVKYRW